MEEEQTYNDGSIKELRYTEYPHTVDKYITRTIEFPLHLIPKKEPKKPTHVLINGKKYKLGIPYTRVKDYRLINVPRSLSSENVPKLIENLKTNPKLWI